MIKNSILYALCASLLLIAGCGGNPIRNKVEQSIEQSLPDMLGPAKSYDVIAYGPTFRMMKGKLDGLDIIGTDVKLSSGIEISRLSVTIRDIAIDKDSNKIKKVGSTNYSATLTEGELTRYVAAKYPDVSNIKINLNKGMVGVSAVTGVAMAKMNVQANADLFVRNKRIIALKLKELKVAGVNAPGFARDYLASKLDTIFDAKDLGFDARIKKTSISQGNITLDGDLDLIQLTERFSN